MKISSVLGLLIVCFLTTTSFASERAVVIPLSDESAGPAATTLFFYGFNSTGAFATQVRYAGIAGQSAGSSEDGHVFPMARAATVSRFTMYITSNTLGVSETMTITLNKNGSPTAITGTFNSSASGVQSIAGSIAYAAGDTFSIPVVASTNASGAINFTGSLDITY